MASFDALLTFRKSELTVLFSFVLYLVDRNFF